MRLPRALPAFHHAGRLLVGLLSLALAGGCARDAGAPPTATAADVERLVIVSPHWEGIREELERAFVAHLAASGRRVQIAWLNPGGSSSCLKFVRSRFNQMPDAIGVDLFFGGGVEPHVKLAEAGLLDPVDLDPRILAALPTAISGVAVYDRAAGWYGACLTTFGVIYNRELLRRLGLPEPTSFADLGEPRSSTWVGLADPRMSGTVHFIYELILQGRGWDDGWRLLARTAGNSRRFYHHASEVPIEVGAGEIALGLALDSYAWSQVDNLGKESMGFLAPSGETVVNPDAISVLKGAANRGLAIEFVEYVLSREGQALWMLPRGAAGGPVRYALARMPVRPDVQRELSDRALVTFDPFQGHVQVAYDSALGAARWNILNGMVGTLFIDLHRDLTSTWREVIAAGRPPAAEELVTRPPVTADELARLAADDYNDPRRRQELHAEWSRAARERLRLARAIARKHRAGGHG